MEGQVPSVALYALHLKEEEDGGGGERMSSSGNEHAINQALLTDLIIVRPTAQSALHTYSWSITSCDIITGGNLELYVTSCDIITGGNLELYVTSCDIITGWLSGVSGSRGVFL